MTIYILDWIREDLIKQGKDLKDYSIFEIKDLLNEYKNKYIK